jgi:hypothetical protein
MAYLNESEFSLGVVSPTNNAFDPGQYQHSPYSAHSELSANDIDEDYTNSFLSLHNNDLDLNTYDPSDFDSNSHSLLMFNDHYASGQGGPGAYGGDYSSPSDNGANDDGTRSRGSSVSSQNAGNAGLGGGHLDVSQFENMSFQSPAWRTEGLPPPSSSDSGAPAGSSSASGAGGHHHHHTSIHQHPANMINKPQSPSRLIMPEDYDSVGNNDGAQGGMPIINAPDGDGDVGAPRIGLIPPTPVSGGGIGGVDKTMPFTNRASE